MTAASAPESRGLVIVIEDETVIADVVRRYGAFARRAAPGEVDHLFLTSLVDRNGMMRVQYLGYRFDPEEMLRDLRSLLRE